MYRVSNSYAGLDAVAQAIGKYWYELDVIHKDENTFQKALVKIDFHATQLAKRHGISNANYDAFWRLVKKTCQRNYLERLNEYLQVQLDERHKPKEGRIVNFSK